MKKPDKRKLSGGPDKTVTWIWLDADGQLKVDFYDFSETAQRMFGNDIAYTITVKDMNKLLLLTKQSETSLTSWIAEKFQSYFEIKKWLGENEIKHEIERESWA